MIDAPPFASLTTLRAAHRQLLESRRTKNGNAAAYFQGIEQFIQRGRATGALLDNSSERWQAQNLIDYWVNELHQSRRELPEATLYPVRRKRPESTEKTLVESPHEPADSMKDTIPE